MRLDKFLIATFDYDKKTRKRLLADKQITIDGRLPVSLRQNIDSQLQEIIIKGERVIQPTEKYFLMHKPEGVICAVKDDEKMTVIDLLKPADYDASIYPVGRLDRFTSGIILLTNNGPLGYRLLHPSHHVSKKYAVTVNGLLTPKHIDDFLQGIIIDRDTLCKPAILEIVAASMTESHAYVTISEGKYHQVKKMFLSVGVKVMSLKRLKFAEFTLDDSLQPGEYRPLNETELQYIKGYLPIDSEL